MCGIFGYLGSKNAVPLVLEGLDRLAYRGYDSAGIAVFDAHGKLNVRKSAGKLENLLTLVRHEPLDGCRGIGHTRWATHGAPSDINAHPHTDQHGEVVLVHNGIVENYAELKRELIAKGHVFHSVTDSEVIPHLIQEALAAGDTFEQAVRSTALRLRGAHAIACLYAQAPDMLIALRIGNAGGVSIGHGEDEWYLASDLPALLPVANTVTSLAPGQMAVLTPSKLKVSTLEGVSVRPEHQVLAQNAVTAAKGGYRHFMLKEIMEQPEAVTSALRGRLQFNPESITLDEVPFSPLEIQEIHRAVFIGMGTSLHAAQIGAHMLESLARIPSVAENAAEFRYRDPVVDKHTLIVSVGQSGETADTLEAMHEAQRRGGRLLAVCNVDGSQATRLAEGTLLMHAGPEVSVASTKTFINSMVCLYLLALHCGKERGHLDDSAIARHVEGISRLPALLGETLSLNDADLDRVVAAYVQSARLLFIGRGPMEPIAREGALKLKEISYIHAEGLPAAEFKHGPISLVDQDTPVVALAPRGNLYEKMVGNIHEVRARSGPVIAIATQGDEQIAEHATDVLWIPPCPPSLTPMVATIPLQLLAYHMAVHRGNDVDQPRNLAKTVTVE